MPEKPIDLNKLDQPLPFLMILTTPIFGLLLYWLLFSLLPVTGEWRQG